MKYQTKSDVIAHAATLGSTATTWNGARRYILASVKRRRFAILTQNIHNLTYCRKAPTPKWQWNWPRTALESSIERNPQLRYRRTNWIARIEARLDREAQRRGIWALNEAEKLAESLTKPYLTNAAASLEAAWPYRRSQSGWAGGEHNVSVHLVTSQYDSCRASGESAKAWSDNGKWSGTNSSASITTDLYTLLTFPSLMTPDGLALCQAEAIGPREYRVKWIEQSTGFGLKTVDGYLIRGYHVRAPGITSARKKAAAARSAAVAATLRERQTRKAKAAGLAAMKSLYVSVEDSLTAGNCKPMTDTFAQQMWRKLGASGPCAVRADVVLLERDDYWTRRAIGAAMTHAQAVS